MGKASSAKKVARAARTGGGRTARGRGSWGFPAVIATVVVLGTAGVVYSRDQHPGKALQSASSTDNSPPRIGDHWHAAYGVDVCGKFLSPITDQTDPIGIHTHGDGVIHIHPFQLSGSRKPFTGKNANLGAFLDSVDASVSQSRIKIPGHDAKRNGQTCNGKDAEVRIMQWDYGQAQDQGKAVTGDPNKLLLRDRQLITIAFLPKSEKIPQPPSAPTLDKLSDLGATTTTVPGAPPPTSTSPPTTSPPTSTTTK